MALAAADRNRLQAAIGYSFRNPEWLERALTHSTRRQEDPAGEPADNEKLEFVGDAVLGLLVSELLFAEFPHWPPGKLSQSKARLVSTGSLSAAARALQLGAYLRLGRGEEKTGGREKETILADAFEALLAAVYLDGGLAAARGFLRRTLLDQALAAQAEELGQPDEKSALQEYLQARGWRPAEYRVISETGPDHQKSFAVEVRVEGEVLALSEGPSKKKAEQLAAGLALARLRARSGLEKEQNV